MSVIVGIPVRRIRGRAVMDYGWDWSVIDEALLLALAVGKSEGTLAALSQDSGLPLQVVAASLARLMRFRFVEVRPDRDAAAFVASAAGAGLVLTGRPLPRLPREVTQRFNFIIERYSGEAFLSREVRLSRRVDLERERRANVDVRILEVDEDAEAHEASLSRLVDLLENRGERRLLRVLGRETVIEDDSLMRVQVVDGTARNLPEVTSQQLRAIVEQVATMPREVRPRVRPTGPRRIDGPSRAAVPCAFDAEDLVIGGSRQRSLLLGVLGMAAHRVLLHSTFLDADRFAELEEPLRAAAARGVTVDLLWGVGSETDKDGRNAHAARTIADRIQADPTLSARVRIRMRVTGSHAKMLLADDGGVGWLAAVSSCNWLSSKFQPVEVTAVLRAPLAVADAMLTLQGMIASSGLSGDLASELYLIARDLRNGAGLPPPRAASAVTVLDGGAHEALMRVASGTVARTLVVGSNRLGSTARTGAILPGEVAAGRGGVDVVILYAQPSGPLRKRHARELAEEAASNGVHLVQTSKVPLHGKFVLWDDDDVVVTSLNWASASTDDTFPAGEVGVHIRSPGIARSMLAQLAAVFPGLGAPTEAGPGLGDIR
ncbi:MAG: phospholipase D-like domain-containing protein [Roseomonas mucosa]|nr:phospholipase D-like domain-containing protein [Roseomonas mucosa]